MARQISGGFFMQTKEKTWDSVEKSIAEVIKKRRPITVSEITKEFRKMDKEKNAIIAALVVGIVIVASVGIIRNR